MSLGLKRGTVQLEPHDKQWDDVAVQTIKTLKSILGDDAIDIQLSLIHISGAVSSAGQKTAGSDKRKLLGTCKKSLCSCLLYTSRCV